VTTMACMKPSILAGRWGGGFAKLQTEQTAGGIATNKNVHSFETINNTESVTLPPRASSGHGQRAHRSYVDGPGCSRPYFGLSPAAAPRSNVGYFLRLCFHIACDTDVIVGYSAATAVLRSTERLRQVLYVRIVSSSRSISQKGFKEKQLFIHARIVIDGYSHPAAGLVPPLSLENCWHYVYENSEVSLDSE
jgi:hypothetical protein